MDVPSEFALMTIEATLAQFIDAHHAEQIEFRQIVRMPSDTPPGNNNPPAEKQPNC